MKQDKKKKTMRLNKASSSRLLPEVTIPCKPDPIENRSKRGKAAKEYLDITNKSKPAKLISAHKKPAILDTNEKLKPVKNIKDELEAINIKNKSAHSNARKSYPDRVSADEGIQERVKAKVCSTNTKLISNSNVSGKLMKTRTVSSKTEMNKLEMSKPKKSVQSKPELKSIEKQPEPGISSNKTRPETGKTAEPILKVMAVEPGKKYSDQWSDCGQIFYTAGKAFGVTCNLRTIYLGSRIEVQNFLDNGMLDDNLNQIQTETLVRIKNDIKKAMENPQLPAERENKPDLRKRFKPVISRKKLTTKTHMSRTSCISRG
jgi:hypothetical protein